MVNPVVSSDEQMLSVITVTLVILAALTVIFTAWGDGAGRQTCIGGDGGARCDPAAG